MSRVVVVLQKIIDGPSSIYLVEPSTHPKADVPVAINMGVVQQILEQINAEPLSENAIEDIGSKLMKILESHPAFSHDVTPLLDMQLDQEEPIYLWMKDPDLEQLPWEALHAINVGFLAGDKLYPLARAQKVIDKKPVATFIPPLKLMVVLGASGNDHLTRLSAQEEWESLYAALKNSELNINVRVLVCEEDLKSKIDAEHQDWITTDFLIGQSELFKDIRNFAPHILHFFCHGIANPLPQLHVATRLNWEREEAGSVRIEGKQLRQLADPDENIWLVTLNCCESAQPAEGTGSRSMPMASSLVSAGFPAAVGMRDRVEKDLAHTFCHGFYDTLMSDFADRIRAIKKNSSAEIHWACGLFAARQRICEEINPEAGFSQAAANSREWTIPVLYTRLQPFRVKLLPDPGIQSAFRSPTNSVQANKAKSRLTKNEERQLIEEMEQLIVDRARFKELQSVVRKINTRLNEIEKELTL